MKRKDYRAFIKLHMRVVSNVWANIRRLDTQKREEPCLNGKAGSSH
jgi:hypothetical protein